MASVVLSSSQFSNAPNQNVVVADGLILGSTGVTSIGDVTVAGNETVSGNVTVGGNTVIGGNLSVTGGAGIQTSLAPLTSMGFWGLGQIPTTATANGANVPVSLLQSAIKSLSPGLFFVTVFNTVTVSGISPTAQFQIVSPGTSSGNGAAYQLVNLYTSSDFAVTLTGATTPFTNLAINVQNTSGALLSNLVYTFTRV